MFSNVYVEKDIEKLPYTQNLLGRLNQSYQIINAYEEYWGIRKKPYLQKRDTLNLYIARKKGELIKVAPPAYGLSGEPHYYFVHAYNCIYECQYCYLQGHFNTPDMVLFVNHEEIIDEMTAVMLRHPDGHIWFHAGEFSDALALSHMTNEWPMYWEFMKNNPRAKLELRTKSANIRTIERLPATPNAITSFTLAPEDSCRRYDDKAPALSTRLKAIERLVKMGHPIGIHFDPIIYSNDIKQEYGDLLDQLISIIPDQLFSYLSIGVVRFTKDVHAEVTHNYPQSNLLAQLMVKSSDNKIRYPRPMRLWILNTIKDLAVQKKINITKIYLCMED